MEGNTLPTTSMETWHPKLTPYRLLVLFTTIGLGTAKAYATSRGVSLAATTIEWIAAVVVFIMLSCGFTIINWRLFLILPFQNFRP